MGGDGDRRIQILTRALNRARRTVTMEPVKEKEPVAVLAPLTNDHADSATSRSVSTADNRPLETAAVKKMHGRGGVN